MVTFLTRHPARCSSGVLSLMIPRKAAITSSLAWQLTGWWAHPRRPISRVQPHAWAWLHAQPQGLVLSADAASTQDSLLIISFCSEFTSHLISVAVEFLLWDTRQILFEALAVSSPAGLQLHWPLTVPEATSACVLFHVA